VELLYQQTYILMSAAAQVFCNSRLGLTSCGALFGGALEVHDKVGPLLVTFVMLARCWP
jgi:hypothetical protein